jgi:hypothetical protein
MCGTGDEMAKVVAVNTQLDQQVERYLAKPITLNEIKEYSVVRSGDGTTMLTVKVYVDNERFDEGVDHFG